MKKIIFLIIPIIILFTSCSWWNKWWN